MDLPDHGSKPQQINRGQHDHGPQRILRGIPKRYACHCRYQEQLIKRCDGDVGASLIGQPSNPRADGAGDANRPSAYAAMVLDLCDKHHAGGQTPDHPRKHMRLDAALPDASDVGHKRHEGEGDSCCAAQGFDEKG